jgi:cadmium resistance protein CadD (predicted permease)
LTTGLLAVVVAATTKRYDDLTRSEPSPYKRRTTVERVLQIFGWILIVVGAFLIFFLASGIITGLLSAIPLAIGIVMVYYSGKRVKQLKKQ